MKIIFLVLRVFFFLSKISASQGFGGVQDCLGVEIKYEPFEAKWVRLYFTHFNLVFSSSDEVEQ